MRGVFLAVLLVLWPVAVPATVLQGPVRVVDGDTLDLNGQRIRLHGIDAPERSAACRGAQSDCHQIATARLAALVQGRMLVCRDLGERTHGRVVAQCLVDGHDLAALLLDEGVVMACPNYARRHPHSRDYMAIEARARAAGRGLFALELTPERAAFCGGAVEPTTTAGDCAIKGNISANGHIYHMPGQRDYDRVRITPSRGERWFCTPEEAEAAGWRPAQR
jgi:endonuclease YncB( thermonuclease family)